MNAETKHTKGPWETRNSRTSDDIGIIGDGGCVAEVFSEIRSKGEGARAEQLANARLIAAAPDMLDAGQRVLKYATLDDLLSDPNRHDDSVFGIRLGDLRVLRAAIAKVTGSAK